MRDVFEKAGFDTEKLKQRRIANFQTFIEKAAQCEDGFADKRRKNHRREAQTDEAKFVKRLK